MVSAAVRDAIIGKLRTSLTDLGLKALKNIEEPVRAYALAPRTDAVPPGAPPRTGGGLPLPSKPSIAVLPFDNLSGDREQEYFADGMVEEIITALSRFRGLFVIARNSSFAYKGRSVDIKQVGRDLGVRYILEGSVRKAGQRVRISGQLIDTDTGAHLWAERFDGALEDIFDLQDQVTANVVGAISPKLREAEIERAGRKPTERLDAYDCYLRGLAASDQMNKDASDEALRMFNKAIELDPSFSLAYASAALCYAYRKVNGWMANPEQETSEAARLARRAVDLGGDDAVVVCFAGLTLGYVLGDMENGAAFVDQALSLNSNLASAWSGSGWMKLCSGELDTALKHSERAMRLSPFDRGTLLWQAEIGLIHFCARRYADAALCAESALRMQPDYAFGLRVLSASKAMEGHTKEAQNAMAQLRRVDPQLRLSNIDNVISPLQPEHRARYIEGLRTAGLPE